MKQPRKIVFATNNAHKLREVRQIMEGHKTEILSLADIGCDDDIPETADTLEGNALIKARWIKERYGYDWFADDTGLEVDTLGGAPGVKSARYASAEGAESHDSAANMALLLKNMEGKTLRTARFRTAIALIIGDIETLFEGKVEGEILPSPRGKDGFGYDPVFRPEGHDCSFAEMTAAEKNAISHRGRAVAKLEAFLKAAN